MSAARDICGGCVDKRDRGKLRKGELAPPADYLHGIRHWATQGGARGHFQNPTLYALENGHVSRPKQAIKGVELGPISSKTVHCMLYTPPVILFG
jgi:hypothetical protein